MSHSRIRANYPISASKLVQRYASASMSDFLMSVANDKVDDETLRREDNRMLKGFLELLLITQPTTNADESILV